jgi:hypothetical protein
MKVEEIMDNQHFLFYIKNFINQELHNGIEIYYIPSIILAVCKYLDIYFTICLPRNQLIEFYEELIMAILDHFICISDDDYDNYNYTIKSTLKLYFYNKN